MKNTKMISKLILSTSLVISPLGAYATSTGVEGSSSSGPSVNQSWNN